LAGETFFIDPEFTRIVDPDPNLVRAAVDELANGSLAPADIREHVLKKVRLHRSRLLNLLADLGVELGKIV